MTLQALLEEDKERFLRVAKDAGNAAGAAEAVREECGRLLAAYNEQAESETEREAARQMLTACAGAAALTDSSGEPVLYTRGASGAVTEGTAVTLTGGTLPARTDSAVLPVPKRFRKSRAIRALGRASAVLLPAGGAACLAAVPLSLLLTGQAAQISLSVPGVFLLSLVGGVLCYFAGRQHRAAAETPPAQVTCFAEVYPDADRIYHHLLTLTMVLDRNLAEVRGSRRIAEKSGAAAADGVPAEPALTELLSQLMETAYAQEDRDAAADLTEAIRYYLHTKGVEAVDYAGDNSAAFDLLPAEREETLRPALLAGGRVLKKGLATRPASL